MSTYLGLTCSTPKGGYRVWGRGKGEGGGLDRPT